jgi:hypothetical protein
MTSLGMLSSEALAELVNLVAAEVERRAQRVGTATTLDRWLTVEQAAASASPGGRSPRSRRAPRR